MKTSAILSSLKYLDSESIQSFLRNVSVDDLRVLMKADEDIPYRLFAEMSERAVEMLEEDMTNQGSLTEEKIAAVYKNLEKVLLTSLGKTETDLLDMQKGFVSKIKMMKKVRDCRREYQQWQKSVARERQQKQRLTQSGLSALEKADYPVSQFHTWSLNPEVQHCINEVHLQQIPVISLVWKCILLAKLCRKNGLESLVPLLEQEKNKETKEALQLALAKGETAKDIKPHLIQNHQNIEQHLAKQFELLKQFTSELFYCRSTEGALVLCATPQNHQFASLADYNKQTLMEKMAFFRQVASEHGYIVMEQHLANEPCQSIRQAIEMIIDGHEKGDILVCLEVDQRTTQASLQKKHSIIRETAGNLAAGASPHRLERHLTCYLDPPEREALKLAG